MSKKKSGATAPLKKSWYRDNGISTVSVTVNDTEKAALRVAAVTKGYRTVSAYLRALAVRDGVELDGG